MATVHTHLGPGEIIAEDVVRGRKSYRVAGQGFDVWLDETKVGNLHQGRAPVDFDNSTALPYNPDPQFPAIPGNTESTIQPIHHIDPDERLRGADSVTFAEREEHHPSPKFAGWQNDPTGASWERAGGDIGSMPGYGGGSRNDYGAGPEEYHEGWKEQNPGEHPEESPYFEDLHPHHQQREVAEWMDQEVPDSAGAFGPQIGRSPVDHPVGRSPAEHDFAPDLLPPERFSSRHEAIAPALMAIAPAVLRAVGPAVARGAGGAVIDKVMGGGNEGGEEGGGELGDEGNSPEGGGAGGGFLDKANEVVDAVRPGYGWGPLIKPSGLSDKYIDITANADYHHNPILQFRHDPDAYISRVGNVLDETDVANDIHLAQRQYMDLVEGDAQIREAAWKDVREKGVRLRTEGRVAVHDISPSRIMATVEGDNGVYDVMISREGMYGGVHDGYGLRTWRCACLWGQWAWKRKYSYVGRLCSHGYAAFLEMQSANERKRGGYPKRSHKTADALQMIPTRLTPELVINDTDDASYLVDVTKDERRDTRPEDVMGPEGYGKRNQGIEHFSSLMALCDRQGSPYPRELVAFLERYAKDGDDDDEDVPQDPQGLIMGPNGMPIDVSTRPDLQPEGYDMPERPEPEPEEPQQQFGPGQDQQGLIMGPNGMPLDVSTRPDLQPEGYVMPNAGPTGSDPDAAPRFAPTEPGDPRAGNPFPNGPPGAPPAAAPGAPPAAAPGAPPAAAPGAPPAAAPGAPAAAPGAPAADADAPAAAATPTGQEGLGAGQYRVQQDDTLSGISETLKGQGIGTGDYNELVKANPGNIGTSGTNIETNADLIHPGDVLNTGGPKQELGPNGFPTDVTTPHSGDTTATPGQGNMANADVGVKTPEAPDVADAADTPDLMTGPKWQDLSSRDTGRVTLGGALHRALFVADNDFTASQWWKQAEAQPSTTDTTNVEDDTATDPNAPPTDPNAPPTDPAAAKPTAPDANKPQTPGDPATDDEKKKEDEAAAQNAPQQLSPGVGQPGGEGGGGMGDMGGMMEMAGPMMGAGMDAATALAPMVTDALGGGGGMGGLASGLGGGLASGIGDLASGLMSGIGGIFGSRMTDGHGNFIEADRSEFGYPSDANHVPFEGSGPLPPLEYTTSEQEMVPVRNQMEDVTKRTDGPSLESMRDKPKRQGAVGITRAGTPPKRPPVEPEVVRVWSPTGPIKQGGAEIPDIPDPYSRTASSFREGAAPDDDPEPFHTASASDDFMPEPGVDVVAQFQRSAAAQAVMSENRGQSNDDLAAAASQFLQRTAGRNFSMAEQAELMNERHPLGARNLDQLDLGGTHYEAENSVGLFT